MRSTSSMLLGAATLIGVACSSDPKPPATNPQDGPPAGWADNGNEIVLDITSSLLENNTANEGGSAVFFVSNDMSGSITIRDSITRNNPRGTFETPGLPGFYVIAKDPAQVINSQIMR